MPRYQPLHPLPRSPPGRGEILRISSLERSFAISSYQWKSHSKCGTWCSSVGIMLQLGHITLESDKISGQSIPRLAIWCTPSRFVDRLSTQDIPFLQLYSETRLVIKPTVPASRVHLYSTSTDRIQHCTALLLWQGPTFLCFTAIAGARVKHRGTYQRPSDSSTVTFRWRPYKKTRRLPLSPHCSSTRT